jgi:hypothetical protein
MTTYGDLYFKEINSHFDNLNENSSVEDLDTACKTFIVKITDLIVNNKLRKYDEDNDNDPIIREINKICQEDGIFNYEVKLYLKTLWNDNCEFVYSYYYLENVDIIMRNLYKNKNKDTYDRMIEILEMTDMELRKINNDPEMLWREPFLEINEKKVKNTLKMRTTTKMTCPECNACIFINSYLKTHKDSKKCQNALLPKPPKKKGTDRIKCCELCPKEDYYSHLSRMKKHRETCSIYNQK